MRCGAASSARRRPEGARRERFLECKNGKAVAKATPKTLRHRSIPQRAVGAIQRQAGAGGTVKTFLCREGTASLLDQYELKAT